MFIDENGETTFTREELREMLDSGLSIGATFCTATKELIAVTMPLRVAMDFENIFLQRGTTCHQ